MCACLPQSSPQQAEAALCNQTLIPPQPNIGIFTRGMRKTINSRLWGRPVARSLRGPPWTLPEFLESAPCLLALLRVEGSWGARA